MPPASDRPPPAAAPPYAGPAQARERAYEYGAPAADHDGETDQRNATRRSLRHFMLEQHLDATEGPRLETTLVGLLNLALTTLWTALGAPLPDKLGGAPRHRIDQHRGRHIVVAHLPHAVYTPVQHEALEQAIVAIRKGAMKEGPCEWTRGIQVPLVILVIPDPPATTDHAELL